MPSLLEFCLLIGKQRGLSAGLPFGGRFRGVPHSSLPTRVQPGPHTSPRVSQRRPGRHHKPIRSEVFHCFCWKKFCWGRSGVPCLPPAPPTTGRSSVRLLQVRIHLGSKAGTSRATSHGINWILLNFFLFFFCCSTAHLCLKTFPVETIPWHGQGSEAGAQQLPGGPAEVVLSRCP